MTLDTYMHYLGAVVSTVFVLFAIAAVIFLSFMCFISLKDAYSLLQSNKPNHLLFPMQLKHRDEEIEKLQKELYEVKSELHDAKQYATKIFSNILCQTQKETYGEYRDTIIKVALAGLEKMRP